MTDTREKLEADISSWVNEHMGVMRRYSIDDVALISEVEGWLDRQAAITKRELQAKHEYVRLKPCVCGSNRRTKWMVIRDGESGYRYQCNQCGFYGDFGNSERAARIAWNEAVEEAGDAE